MRWSWLQRGLQLTGDEIAAESPMRHLPTASPPLVIAVGGRETQGFLDQSRDYHTALVSAGHRATFLNVPDRHHFDVLDELGDANGLLWRALSGMAAG